MHAWAHHRYLARAVGACIAISAVPAWSDDIPWIALEDVSLNPSNFYVSIRVTNAWSQYYFALEAYDGEPGGGHRRG